MRLRQDDEVTNLDDADDVMLLEDSDLALEWDATPEWNDLRDGLWGQMATLSVRIESCADPRLQPVALGGLTYLRNLDRVYDALLRLQEHAEAAAPAARATLEAVHVQSVLGVFRWASALTSEVELAIAEELDAASEELGVARYLSALSNLQVLSFVAPRIRDSHTHCQDASTQVPYLRETCELLDELAEAVHAVNESLQAWHRRAEAEAGARH
jgi:hypothetical protein